ncbi:hypothetical protein SUGI_0530200 [Cryptomeria japonica]|nr:hypothetical protein SUGI_0530200 [Cryptomeria japonica]
MDLSNGLPAELDLKVGNRIWGQPTDYRIWGQPTDYERIPFRCKACFSVDHTTRQHNKPTCGRGELASRDRPTWWVGVKRHHYIIAPKA